MSIARADQLLFFLGLLTYTGVSLWNFSKELALIAWRLDVSSWMWGSLLWPSHDWPSTFTGRGAGLTGLFSSKAAGGRCRAQNAPLWLSAFPALRAFLPGAVLSAALELPSLFYQTRFSQAQINRTQPRRLFREIFSQSANGVFALVALLMVAKSTSTCQLISTCQSTACSIMEEIGCRMAFLIRPRASGLAGGFFARSATPAPPSPV